MMIINEVPRYEKYDCMTGKEIFGELFGSALFFILLGFVIFGFLGLGT